MKLFMLKLGATPKGRLIEQHDVFFGIAEHPADLIPAFEAAWPEAAGNWHIDCWREVSQVGGHAVRVVPREQARADDDQLFFINLGGYRPGEFEEYHHKMLIVAPSSQAAIAEAKRSDFYRDFDFAGAVSHVDDKHGVDVDEIHNIGEVLAQQDKQRYALHIRPAPHGQPDEWHIGYLNRNKFAQCR